MTVAERMRRDGFHWRPELSCWQLDYAGYRIWIEPTPSRCATVRGEYHGIDWMTFVPPLAAWDGTMHGLRSLAQRAKSAARRLARKGRKP